MVDVGQRGVDTVRAVWGKWVACLGMAASAVGREGASMDRLTLNDLHDWRVDGVRLGS